MALLTESLGDSPRPPVSARLREPWFSVEVFTVDTDTPMVVVRGEVDMITASELAEVVSEVLETFPRRLVFDLYDVSLFGSAGVRVLEYARRGLPAGCPVILRRPQPLVRRVLEITGMNDLCVIED